MGKPERIGHDFFEDFAADRGLRVGDPGSERGLMPSFDALRSEELDPDAVDPSIRHFYERTSEYRLDVWSQWSGAFRPFGWAVATLFSKRLEQLNVPLSPLSTREGFTNSIVALEDPETGQGKYTAWVRRNRLSGEVIYAASYSVTRLPGHEARFVKVVFPLPNGNAMVILRPTASDDGSLLLRSRGTGFGDAGFYFLVRAPRGRVWVHYVSTFREAIRVYVNAEAELRTDHDFHIWRRRFMRLHYRMEGTGSKSGDQPGGAPGTSERFAAP